MSTSQPAGTRASVSVLSCDLPVVAFAGWTVAANAVALSGGTPARLAVTGPLAATLAVAGLVFLGRRSPAAPHPAPPAAPEAPPSGRVWALRAIVLAALATVTVYRGTSLLPYWMCGFVLLGAASLRSARLEVAHAEPSVDRRSVAILVACAIACAVITAITHRFDKDDSFYLNVAVTAADQPFEALFAYDTLHGLRDLPLMIPVYRVQSLELLSGVASWLTGARAIFWAHTVVPCVAALLAPFALARLFRSVLPGRWLLAVVLVLAYLLLVGAPARGFANFAFVRLHQGKSILVTLGVPLILAYGISFAAQPDLRRWVLLAASQVAAVGLSVTGLWLAPAVAGLGVLAGLSWNRRAVRVLALGLASSAYVVALALWMRTDTAAALARYHISTATVFSDALDEVWGQGPVSAVVLLAMLASWSSARSARTMRFATVVPLGLFVLWNPFTARWLADNVTGPTTYWRVLWVAPAPLFLALALAQLPMPLRARPSALVSLVTAALLFTFGPSVHTLSEKNGVTFSVPGPRVEPGGYAAAETLARLAPHGRVLAPVRVSVWVPTVHDHPYPLIVRRNHLRTLEAHLGVLEVARRVTLTRIATGHPEVREAAPMLADALDDYALDAVCLARTAGQWPEVVHALRDHGFERVETEGRFEFWVRNNGE